MKNVSELERNASENKHQFKIGLFTEEGIKYRELYPRQCGRNTRLSLMLLRTTTCVIRNLLGTIR